VRIGGDLRAWTVAHPGLEIADPPSCGVTTTLDLRASIDVVAACPAAALTREAMNQQAVLSCRRPRSSIAVWPSIRAIQRLRCPSVADSRPTWQLVLEVARGLSARHSSFRLADIVEGVQRIDPPRPRTSIQPIVQGMTSNAGRGPKQPCGKVLLRTDHGWYRVLPEGFAYRPATVSATRPSRRPTSPRRSGSPIDVSQRVTDVIDRFDDLVAEYDRSGPFRRSGQYELHRRTIDLRRELGTARAAIESPKFAALLHDTLQKWGIGRRASRLLPVEQFHDRLLAVAGAVDELDGLSIEDPGLDGSEVAQEVDAVMQQLGVVSNQSIIVAGTKTLHHLLPDLVPPMDRQWTGAFFGWWPIDPQNRHTAILTEAYTAFVSIATTATPSRLVGDGWRTSATKVLDNAVVAYCSLNGIKPRGQA
jgi:hypothetical protein